MDTRVTPPVCLSRTKMSVLAFVSPMMRLFASDSKATNRPSLEIDGRLDASFACAPTESIETRVVSPGAARTEGGVAKTEPDSKTAIVRNATALETIFKVP